MKAQWDMKALLKTSNAYWKGCALQAGVRLDIFTVLGKGPAALSEVANACGADQRGMEYLLNALAAMGLIEKNQESYANTQESYDYLCADSDVNIRHILLHHHHLLDGWAQLDQAVLTGQPIEKRSYGVESERESFLMGMFNLAMSNAPRVAMALDLSDRRQLLDLGGGPGTYAVHFCLAHPDLKATVFDLPTSERFAERTVTTFGLQDRIGFYGGNFNQDPLPDYGFDVVWISHILHSNGPEACLELIKKSISVMQPGGILLIHDFFLNDTKSGPEFAALFALNMLINNPEGRSYSEKEVREMLHEAGAAEVERLDFFGPNASSIIRATV